MFWNKKSKVAEDKIDSSTRQVLELEAQKLQLKMQVDQIQLELDNQKARNAMALEKDRHAQQLKLDTETAKFSLAKEKWEIEKAELIRKSDNAAKEVKDTLEREHKISLQEAVSLTKLESQQKVKQAELDRDREINALKMTQVEELSKVRTQAAEDTFKKLSAFIEEVTMKGDKNTNFVQELALKMFNGAPQPRSSVDIEVGVNRQPALELKSGNS